MVLYSGLDSIVESLYLDEEMTESIKDSSIVVNPNESLCPYIYRKVVIINHLHYPTDRIRQLKESNKVITRVNFSIRGVSFKSYELRLNRRIQLSGEEVGFINEDTYDQVEFRFDGQNLYYPSPSLYCDCIHRGALTSLGYLLYQIGYDFIDDTLFKNLDVIKLKNGLII